ncbi:MAG: response regulator, partial [Bdellovibrionales bacterium]|nr:response regulator [Bdellovibrionales bacterium]
IRDTGIGISHENMVRLFEPFTQADASITRTFGGTGLGLALSRRLTQLLGGDLTCESVLGSGSTFTVAIATGTLSSASFVRQYPNPDSSHAYPQGLSVVPQLSGRVLVADDGEDNRALLQYLLARTGLEVTLAADGAEAVRRVTTESYDLILMDMQMPVVDGFEATEEVRRAGVKVPIIALTATILKERICRCFSAGCDAHLSKPFQRAELYRLLDHYLGSSVRPDAARPDPSGNAVLPADDPEFKRVQQSFRQSLVRRSADLVAAIEDEAWDTVAIVAHRLISAELFGFGDITDTARALEQAAMQSQHDEAQALATQLLAQIKTIKLTHGRTDAAAHPASSNRRDDNAHHSL